MPSRQRAPGPFTASRRGRCPRRPCKYGTVAAILSRPRQPRFHFHLRRCSTRAGRLGTPEPMSRLAGGGEDADRGDVVAGEAAQDRELVASARGRREAGVESRCAKNSPIGRRPADTTPDQLHLDRRYCWRIGQQLILRRSRTRLPEAPADTPDRRTITRREALATCNSRQSLRIRSCCAGRQRTRLVCRKSSRADVTPER
jgi:hypothetical protein